MLTSGEGPQHEAVAVAYTRSVFLAQSSLLQCVEA